MKKKLLIYVLILVCVFTTFTLGNNTKVKAADGTVTITVSKGNAIVGETIEVNVNLSYSKTYAAAQFQLLYDQNVMSCPNGSDGVIALNYMDTDYPSSFDWKYTFTATQTGTCNFSINGILFIDIDGEPFQPALGTASVKVMAPGSDDATLSSLQVGGVQIYVDNGAWNTQGFQKNVTNYVAGVNNDITSVAISATSSQADGRIEISGDPSNLQVGNNVIVITSYAPNGDTMKYQVNIIRKKSEPVTEAPTAPPGTKPIETEPPITTEAPTEPPEAISITIDGKDYKVVSNFASEKVPSGFYLDIDSFNDKEVVTAKNDRYGLTLYCLEDEEENSDFYIYDGEKFYKYAIISTPTGSYIVYDCRKANEKPAGDEVDIEVLGKKVKGFVNPGNDEFVFFYAMNNNKDFFWYSYDTVEGTIQRAATLSETAFEEETTAAEETTSYEKATENKTNQNKDKGISFKLKDALIIAIVVLALIITIVIVVICAMIRKKKASANDDYFDEPEIAATSEEKAETIKQETVEKVSEADVQDFIKEAENLNKDK